MVSVASAGCLIQPNGDAASHDPNKTLDVDERCIITPVPTHTAVHAVLKFSADESAAEPLDHLRGEAVIQNRAQGKIALFDPADPTTEVTKLGNHPWYRFEFDIQRSGTPQLNVRVLHPGAWGSWTLHKEFQVAAYATAPTGFLVERLPPIFIEKYDTHQFVHLQFRKGTPMYASLLVKRVN
jgi:hypothetical protein